MPIRKKVTVADALRVLNRALRADPEAMRALREARVECNEDLANDPEIQCGLRTEPGIVHDIYQDDEPVTVGGRNIYTVGFLGVLNGIFGIDARTGHGPIAAVYVLLCPYCKLDPDQKLKAGEPCPECGATLKLGGIRKFVAVDHSKLPTLER